MTTKAQLHKTALSLPDAVEDQRDGLLTYAVHGKVFADVNGMELNNLVFKSWLNQAPQHLASAARAAMKSEAPAGPDALPKAIGKPATRALLLAGVTNLEQVANHTEAQLLELHGVGPRAVRVLREALSATGRGLAG